ncbi:hypothetical protein DSECCO2_467280 [anaerobic digester metagenome]
MNPTRTRQECLDWLRANPRAIEPGQDVKVAPFRPEDAEGVARLYFAVYGDNFPLDYVYDPASIAAANAGPDLYQYVARTPSGDVVGVSALFRAAPFEGIMESGGLMVLPGYRSGFLAVNLTAATIDTLPQELGLNAVFGQCVCDLLSTQKMVRKFAYNYYAMELEAMPPRPEESVDGVGGRISLLNALRVFRDRPHTVHLPERYARFIQDIYAATGLQRTTGAPQPAGGPTRSTMNAMDAASLAKLLVHEPGTDMQAAIEAFEARHPGRHVYHLQLPLAHPALPEAVETARARGYFYAGVLPLWTGTDVLLLQKLSAEPDFSLPRLLGDDAKKLLAFIRADRESLAT